ncbi:polysaccharide biosynthesis/export family protein [Puia sp.]|jgi:polysaccharide export outer membrane protein|uniref:polysaccharide biosynthesis/export family protein n=1 Tax=Puia sp. TaxID=2045100 RepID=UPI002F3FC6F6
MKSNLRLLSRHLPACFLALVVLSLLLASCGSTRNIVYMQGAFDTAKLSNAVYPEPLIQKGDLISIIVYSDNAEATRIFNQSLITTAGAGSASEAAATSGITGQTPSAPGYLVDESGNIEFQELGLLHVDGLTRAALKDTLANRLKGYLNNPYFNIRFLNYKFTMIGEVQRPGIYTIPGDHINILEALGMAGDMTFYGRRDNVLVIRETDGKREWARLDLTKPDIMASPFFTLRQNDVVVFEPSRKKVAANDQTTVRNLTIITGLISTFAILYTIFK